MIALKKYTLLIIAPILLMLFCCGFEKPKSDEIEDLKEQKTLIVYLSRTKNTKTVAQLIQKHVGGDLVELELEKPYPENYKAIVDQVANENKTNYLPPLKTKIDSIEKYDVVFIGFPTWGMQLLPPMKSFLKQYNFKGKTIIPFNTNAGYGIGSSFDKVEKLCPDSKIEKGFSVKGGIERDGILYVMEGEKKIETEKEITVWLKNLNLLKN